MLLIGSGFSHGAFSVVLNKDISILLSVQRVLATGPSHVPSTDVSRCSRLGLFADLHKAFKTAHI
jgi:hypothetical protein